MIRKEFLNIKDKIPFIYNALESLDLILTSNKTIIKMGDGQFDLILSNLLKQNISYTGMQYQIYNQQLTNKLHNIIISKNENIDIMIGRSTFYEDYIENNQFSIWNLKYGKSFIQKLNQLQNNINFFNLNRKYLDMGIFIPTRVYDKNKVNFDNIFQKLQLIFKDKDIIIVTGDKEIEKYNEKEFLLNNISKSIQYYYTPIRDSYSIYQQCINDLKDKKDKLICMVSGPMGKILAYDLQTNYDIRSICVGHLFRDYKHYKNNITNNTLFFKD